MIGQILRLVGKDLRIEWRGKSRLLATLLFAIVSLLLFSFAVGPDTQTMRRAASGFLAMALMLSSTLALSESFRVERDDGAFEGLLLLPVGPIVLYTAKALSNTIFLLALGPILCPVAMGLYAVKTDGPSLLALIGLWGLASAGLSAPGTLYAAMTSRLRGQDVLLPLLLFPLIVPLLLALVKAMTLVIQGDPMGQINSWLMLMAGFTIIYWSICAVLAPFAIEEV